MHNMQSAVNAKMHPKRYMSYICVRISMYHVVKIKVPKEAHCSVHLVFADGTRRTLLSVNLQTSAGHDASAVCR